MSEQEYIEEMEKTYKKRSKFLRTGGMILNTMLILTTIIYFVLEYGFPEMGEFKTTFEILTDSLLHLALGVYGTFELRKWYKERN